MLLRTKMLRLLLGASLGLAFFGCMGLPRRRPLAEVNQPELPQRSSRIGDTQADSSRNQGQPPQAPQRPDAAVRQTSVDTTPPAPIPTPTPVVRATAPPTQPLRTTSEPAPPQPPAPPPSPEPKPPSPPPGAGAPAVARTAPPPANPVASLRQLYQAAAQSYAGINAYIVRFTRREFIKAQYQPEEVILFKFRREPFSVYLKWVGPLHKGREVVYVKGRFDNKLHTLLAAGDMPLMAAGKRFSLPVDSTLLLRNSRHAITEAGIGALLNHVGAVLDAVEKGDKSKGTLTYLGQQKRPEFSAPLDAIEWKVPPGADPTLPRGGRRWCFCDRDNHLPALLITHDDRDQEVEYYRYDRYQLNVPLDDNDFDPDKIWTRPGR